MIELDRELALEEKSTAQRKVILEALERGEVIGYQWGVDHHIANYRRRIGELMAEGKKIEPFRLPNQTTYCYRMKK